MREEYAVNYEGKESPIIPIHSVSFPIHHVFVIQLITTLQVGNNDDYDDDDDFNTFANISVTKRIGSQASELDEYLRKPVENIKDPLKWWIANRHVYPKLHRMALDYLSIPGK